MIEKRENGSDFCWSIYVLGNKAVPAGEVSFVLRILSVEPAGKGKVCRLGEALTFVLISAWSAP